MASSNNIVTSFSNQTFNVVNTVRIMTKAQQINQAKSKQKKACFHIVRDSIKSPPLPQQRDKFRMTCCIRLCDSNSVILQIKQIFFTKQTEKVI